MSDALARSECVHSVLDFLRHRGVELQQRIVLDASMTMGTSKEHAAASATLNAGPGGIRCSCCNPFRGTKSAHAAKKLASRLARRVNKAKQPWGDARTDWVK